MTTVGTATIELRGDIAHFQQSMARASSEFKAVGGKMKSVGRTLTANVTLPLAALGAGSVKAFADFDNAMTQSLAIMGDVSETMRKDMVDAARDVARTTTTSATKAAEAYFFLASAGLDAKQSVAALPQVAAFAQAGMFDMARATDLATDAQSALGLTSKDAQENLKGLTRITDILVGANTLANASVEQFSVALTSQAGAALKSFGKDAEEGVAVLAAFADQGVKAELAGNSLSRIMRLLATAAVNNKEALKEYGIEILDAQGNMRNLGDIIANLEDAFEGMSDGQRTAALQAIGFKAKVQGAILPLLGTSDAIKEYEASMRRMGGITQEVKDKQLSSFTAQMTLVKNNVVIAAQKIGEVMAPAIGRLGGFIKRVADAISEANPSVIRWGVVLAGVAAAIGPLLIVLGSTVAAVGALLPVLAAITGPVGLVIAAVAAAGAAFVVFRKEIAGFLSGAFEKLKPVLLSAGKALQAFGSLVATIVLPILKRVAGFIGNTFARNFNIIATVLRTVAVPAFNALARMFAFIEQVVVKFRDKFKRVWIDIQIFLITAVQKIVNAVAGLGEAIPLLGNKIGVARTAFDDWANNSVRGLRRELAGIRDGALTAIPVFGSLGRAVDASGDAAEDAAGKNKNLAGSIRDVAQAVEEVPLLKFTNADFSAIGGEAFRGGIRAAMPELKPIEGVRGTGFDEDRFRTIGALTPEQRQKFIDGVPLEELTGELKSFGERANELMAGIGQDLVNGLINGTLSAGDILKSFLMSFASKFILGPLSGALGIFSPSRVTKGFGKQLGMGFIRGMDGMQGMVSAAANRLALAAVPQVASVTNASLALAVPGGTREIRESNRPLNIYLPDAWADPDAFARSPGGQRYFRVADDVASYSGHRRAK